MTPTINALRDLLERYTGLVKSGDAGNWDCEEEPVVIAARAALADAEAELTATPDGLNLHDPAVQKRLAAQWGYVAAAPAAEPTDPCLVLWQAMNEAEKAGNRTDDKLIVEFLRRAGYVISAPQPAKAAQPLTEERIRALRAEAKADPRTIDQHWFVLFARAIERTCAEAWGVKPEGISQGESASG